MIALMGKPLRIALGAAVGLGVMWLTLSSAGALRPRARAAATCNQTFVKAKISNETSQRMEVWAFRFGATNAVCNGQDPTGVPAGTDHIWMVGDNLFSTDVTIRYRLDNGDQVELHALAEKGNRSAPLSCGWTTVVSSPRAFDCAANWESGGVTGEGVIRLRVFPAARRVSADVAQANIPVSTAAARSCPTRSALIGTTTNHTGVPLQLLSASRGSADAWCRAPGGSQPAHSVRHWKLGGPRSGASTVFVYRLPDGDDVEFAARVNSRGGAIGCAPFDRAKKALFGCRAVRKVAPGSEAPSIDFQVFPIRRG
jgi:hypothetical protein